MTSVLSDTRGRVIALIGNLSRDLIPGRPPTVGGGPFHGARALQRLRVPARIVARCAAADRDALLPPVIRLGTPVRYVAGAQTRDLLVLVRRRPTRDADRGARRPLAARRSAGAAADAVGARSAARHVTSSRPRRSRRSRGAVESHSTARASFACRRSARCGSTTTSTPTLLRHIWVLKLAEEEAEVVGDLQALGVREVLVTHGSRGATVYTAGTTRARQRPRCRRRSDRRRRRLHDRRTSLHATPASDPSGAARRATAVVAAVLSRR